MSYQITMPTAWTTSERACYAAFEHAAEDILFRHLTPTDYNERDVQQFLENAASLISGNIVPEDCFKYMRCGAFKECYHSGIDGWIIKFYSSANDTAAERQILNAAHDAGVQQLFLPTYFIEFPFSIPCTYLDDSGEYTLKYRPSQHTYRTAHKDPDDVIYLVGCELQPIATVSANIKYEYAASTTEYDTNPIMMADGSILPYEDYSDIGTTVLSWVRDLVNFYGDDQYRKMFQFIRRLCISDLHNENIGYYKDRPIILDWLSANPDNIVSYSH